MFTAERAAFRRTFVLSRPTVRGSLLAAAVYTAQAAACLLLLAVLYRYAPHTGVWADISAVLALQPGLHQSVVTSVVRVLANTVGATAGLLVGTLCGSGAWQLVLTIAVVAPACELLRLGVAQRTACVAAIIVLTVGGGLADGGHAHLMTTGAERFTATVVGCSVALLVQVATELARAAVRRTRPADPAE